LLGVISVIKIKRNRKSSIQYYLKELEKLNPDKENRESKNKEVRSINYDKL
jgi:hypothetical protein